MPRQPEVGAVALGLPKCCEPSGGGATMIGCAASENGDLQRSFVLWAVRFLGHKRKDLEILYF